MFKECYPKEPDEVSRLSMSFALIFHMGIE